jgi:uncharacterized protein YqjF (DUF2071 family)
MTMRWHDLLFLHWPVSPSLVRPLIPEGLELDTFDGSAWIGIICLQANGVRPRYLPALAAMAFPELSVRTYVWSPGRSGVWFLSLDAANRVAVRAARLSYRLPYYDARITVQRDQSGTDFRSTRVVKTGPAAEFHAVYTPAGTVYRSAPETLDRWVTDRYCLYGVNRSGRLGYIEIHHAPWPLQKAEIDLRVNTMMHPLGIELPHTPPVAHFAGYLEVFSWPFVPVEER